MIPSPEMRAAAADLEAVLALQLGTGDTEALDAQLVAATERAGELGLPTDERALEPLPALFDVVAPSPGTVLATHLEGGRLMLDQI